MALLELVGRGADADLVREPLASAAERPVAAEVDRLTGAARTPDRTNHRNGHRERGREARAGRTGPAVPRPREGSYLPASPEPRRTAGKAPAAAVREAGARPPARAAGPGGPRRPDPLGRRPGRGDGRHRRPEGPGLAPARGHRRARPGLPLAAGRGELAPPPGRRHLPRVAQGRPDRQRRRDSRRAGGRREVPGVATGASGAEVLWAGFLRSPAGRGPRGVGLATADDHEGLRAAARRVLTAGPRRCRVRRARNLPGHAAPGQRAAVAAMIRAVLARDARAGAFARRDEVADPLRAGHDRLGALTDASRGDVLADTGHPEAHRAGIASTSPLERVNTSTSPLERVNREIERRADVAGVFPDDEAVIRPVGALTLERSDERAAGRRHSGPESLARLADAHSPRPPAVAARGSSDPS